MLSARGKELAGRSRKGVDFFFEICQSLQEFQKFLYSVGPQRLLALWPFL